MHCRWRKLAGRELRSMTNEFVHHLKTKGFTHVSFDMAGTVHITAWRKNERKTYNVYGADSLEEAETKLIALIDAPVEVKVADPFSDILG